MKSMEDDTETVIDTDDMELEPNTLNKNSRIILMIDKMTNSIKEMFKFDKKAKIDYTYLTMLEIIKGWNTCTENEFTEKYSEAQKLLDELEINSFVVGISVCKLHFCEKYMSTMMYPLFVAVMFYDTIQCCNRTVCIFKDIHQALFPHYIIPTSSCTVAPGTLDICEDSKLFNKRLLSHAEEATSKKRKFC